MKSIKSSFLSLAILLGAVLPVAAQQTAVRGTVSDPAGAPLVGVTVMADATHATITAADGSYSLRVPADAVLTFSSIGYKTVEETVGGRTLINVVLAEDAEYLDEIVVVGYGVQKKATLTGSISAVNGEELKKVSTANLSNTLAGKTAGVIANMRSGEPGEDDAVILIRGKGTLGDTSPLIVVDGIADRDFSRLNPEDIESISILKDASAAIYGARAANGVILVTTKRGAEGKVRVSYNGSYTLSQPTRVPQMLNAYQYGTYVNEYDAIERHAQAGQTYTQDVLNHYLSGDDPVNYPSADWWGETTRKWAGKTQHSVSLSGGSDKVSFYTSAQYMTQDAIYKDSAYGYDQYQFVTNVDAKLNKSIRMSLDILGRQENRKRGNASTDYLFTYFLTTFPGSAPFYPNGLPRAGYDGLTNNAAVMMTDKPGHSNTVRNILTLKPLLHIDLDVLTPGLYLEGYAALDMMFSNTKSMGQPFDLYQYDRAANEYVNRHDDTGVIWVDNSSSNSRTVTLNGRIGYRRTFGEDHHVDAFAAYEQMKYDFSYLSASRTNYLSSAIPELFAGSAKPEDKDNTGYSTAEARVNFFGRMNYDYKEKYLAEITWRYDGSMNFAPGHRWGFFPGASAGWVLSEEDFWAPLKDKVSFFKLKGSWGMMGNDNVAAYQYMTQYQFTDYAPFFDGSPVQGFEKVRTANPDITWEKATTYNVGLVAGFLGGKYTLEADYFLSNRRDILITRNASVPTYSGLTLPQENLGKVRNQGFEVIASYRDHAGDWEWGVNGNLTYARNKIVYMDEAADTPDWQRREGYPIDSQLLYDAVKIYQTDAEAAGTGRVDDTVGAGDLMYTDTDGNGTIDANDMVRIFYTATPRLMYGLTLNASWKGIDVNCFFQGQGLSKRLVMPTMNMPVDFYEGRWIDSDASTHANARWPRALIKQTYTDKWNGLSSTWWLRDASFLRLKSLEIGYTFPKDLVRRISVENLRIYVNGSNLFTIDKFKVADPEVGYVSSSDRFSVSNPILGYPLQRMINFGVNLTF